MATRFYIVPSETIPSGIKAGGRRAGYVYDLILPTPPRAMFFGAEPVALTGVDVTPAQHSTLAALSPITVVPADLTSTVGANLAAVQTALESWNIPAQWVTSGLTYREVLKGVATIFQFAQRFHGLHQARIFLGGITLATTVSQLTQVQRDKLAAVSASFGWDTSGVTGATTMRQLLRGAAQQFAEPVLFAGEVF